MTGFLSALIAGAAMSVQGVMNTQLGKHTGVMEASAFVQFTGFLLALAVAWIFGNGDIRQLTQAPWYTWLGGLIAPVITVTVMWAISGLSPTVGISTILLAQLATAAIIDATGFLGSEKLPFTWHQWVGIALMAGGVFLMKWQQQPS